VSVGTAFLEKALLATPPLHTSLEPADPHAAFAEKLWNHRDDLHKVTLHVFVNGLVPTSKLDERMLGDIPMKIEVWDARRLGRVHEGQVDQADEIIVDFDDGLACVHCPSTDDRYDAYLLVVPGTKLAEIYNDHGPRMLQENVRAFLQLNVAVNKGIRKTLIEEPGAFFAYNNGLSATADEVKMVGEPGSMRIQRIRGLQIVNGAQTTGSIHRLWRVDPASLERVQVPVKLTRVNNDSRGEMVARISRHANSQTAVKQDDFSANHPFQVELENLSRRLWAPPKGDHRWYYERTRGQYHDELARQPTPGAARKFRQENPTRQRFTKTDVARYVHAWDRRPELVALGAQKNYVRFTAEWLKKGWSPDDAWYRELIAKAIIFDAVRSITRQSGVPGYAANVVAYIVALISDRFGDRLSLRHVWDSQSLSPAFRSYLQLWIRPVYDALVLSASGRNVTEWCKKPDCWDDVRKMELPQIPAGLPEITSTGSDPRDGGRTEDRDRSTGPIEIDFSVDREKLLRLARGVVAGKTMKREDAIRELQELIGVKRLTTEKRAELESLFADLTRVAFMDDDATGRTNDGLAIVRKLLRAGTRDHASLLTDVAREWLQKQRVGSRVREELDELFKIAKKRKILVIDGESVSCPTPQFDSYEAAFLQDAVLEIIQRKGRLYPRRAVSEAIVKSLGFSHLRSEMIDRVDGCIEALVAAGMLRSPDVGWLERERAVKE
jgi:hypothetical protein